MTRLNLAQFFNFLPCVHVPNVMGLYVTFSQLLDSEWVHANRMISTVIIIYNVFHFQSVLLITVL